MYTANGSDGFSITRVFSVRVETVWDAWTQSAALAAWWRTHQTIPVTEEWQVDLQVGGHYRYTTVNMASGELSVTGGTYQELDPPHRLVFTWGQPHADAADTPLVAVTLEPENHGTLLFFELRGASGAPGDHFFYDGWSQVLDSLDDYLTSSCEGA